LKIAQYLVKTLMKVRSFLFWPTQKMLSFYNHICRRDAMSYTSEMS